MGLVPIGAGYGLDGDLFCRNLYAGNIASSSGPFLDVSHPDFGAIPGGVIDAAPAIQKAHDLLPAAGGTIYVPSGTYLVGLNTLVFTKSNVTLLGENGAVLKAAPGALAASKFLQIGGTAAAFIKNVMVQNLTFDGQGDLHGSLGTGTQAHILELFNCERVWVQNCFFYNSAGDHINLTTTTGQGCKYVFITNNYLETCRRNGISATAGEHLIIDGNVINGFNTMGIALEPNSGKTLRGVLVTGNTVIPNPTFLSTGSANSDRLYGIASKMTAGVDNARSQVRIIGNFCYGVSDTTQYPTAGIWSELTRSLVISANVVFECRQGIVTSSEGQVDGTTGVIDGNHVRRCVGAGVVGIGVYHRCVVSNNHVEECDNVGIYLFRGPTICKGNFVRNNGQHGSATLPYGIYSEGDSNVIEGNVSIDDQSVPTQDNGIFIADGTISNQVYNNDVALGNTATPKIRVNASLNFYRANKGFVTENTGTGTITDPATSATVTHGLAVTPRAQDIRVNFTENPTNPPLLFWLSGITSTQFVVNVGAAPGASNLDFAWAVAARYD